MNKKLMVLGLCMMGAFSAVQADEPEAPAADTTVVATETTVAAPTTETTTVVDEKDDKDCGCGKR